MAATLQWQLKPKPPQANLKGGSAGGSAAADPGTVTDTTVLQVRLTVPAVDWIGAGFSPSGGMGGGGDQASSVVIGGKGGVPTAAAYTITGYSADAVQLVADQASSKFKNMGFEQWGDVDGQASLSFEMESFTSTNLSMLS